MKYKVGDKVRITAGNHGAKQALVGKTGEVTAVDVKYEAYPYSVSIDGRNAWLWRDDELELVVDPPTFKVGDRVKVVNTTWFSGCYSNGAVGVIESLNDHETRPIKVRIEDVSPKSKSGTDYGRGHSVHYTPDELELIAPAAPLVAPPAPSYAVGDKIRILPTTSTSYAGRTFIVASIDVYEGKARIGAKVNDLSDVVGFFLDEIEPAPARTWRKPADTGDVGYDVIDEMADSASKRVVSVGGEVLERLGNVAVVATKERVYVYRLEATSEVSDDEQR